MPVETPTSCEELLRRMVGFDTVNSALSGKPAAEAELSRYLEALGRELGFETRQYPVDEHGPNLLLTHQTAPGASWLLFESHLDTVGVEGMSVDPFGGRVEGGRMVGRGACDTKGSGAAMLWALKRYADGARQPNNIGILYSVDEECRKAGVTSFVREDLPGLPWRPADRAGLAGVIVGEPTDLQVVVAHNGVVRWQIVTEGVAAHSSNPANGRSAISMMVKVIDALETGYIPHLEASHPLTGKAQCSINIIRGGTQINIIPARCVVEVDRRVVPGEDLRQVLPATENILDALRRDHPDLKVTQTEPRMDPPLDPEGNRVLAEAVSGALEPLGLRAPPAGVRYGSDASTFAAAGIPALLLGPGNIAQAHTHDEWLALDQLRRAVDAYHAIMGCEIAVPTCPSDPHSSAFEPSNEVRSRPC